MSEGRRLRWQDAYRLARRAHEELEPVVARLKAAGSLRRRKPWVSDIEFVAEPYQVTVDLLGDTAPDTEAVESTLRGMGTWVKGAKRQMQITDLYGVEGFHLEVYLVHPPAEWGSILAIRTGPAALGQLCVTRMKDRGFRHREGHVETWPGKELVPTETEEAFFEAAGVPCVPPHQREDLARQLQRQGVGV